MSEGSDITQAHGRLPSLSGPWWTLPLTTLGMGIIACSLIVGQAEDNRHLAWQKNKLQMDLDYLKEQAARNDEFLDRLGKDENLVERIAQRQMNLVRSGQAVLELKTGRTQTASPVSLVNVPPPPA